MSKKEKKSAEKIIYSSEQQPKDDKLALSILVGLFFAFNLMFFGPMEFYLSNIESLGIPVKYMLISLIPAAVAIMAAVFLVCFLTKKKLHIIMVSLFLGIGAAMYVQGNFLSIKLGEFDGTLYRAGVGKLIVNTIIWLLVIAVPFLMYKFNRPFYKGFVAYISVVIFLIELITLAVLEYRFVFNDETGALSALLENPRTYDCTTLDEYTYSSNKNFIIILTDEYDSFCFDSAIEAEPDSVSGFDGFTYYKNTLGMYSYTDKAIPYILTGEPIQYSWEYPNDTLFSNLSEEYKINLYATLGMFPEEMYEKYADNYVERNITYKDYLKINGTFSKAILFKYMPEVLKAPFQMSGSEFTYIFSSEGLQSYFYDDLSFYNNLRSELDIVEENCFKFIYLNGLHDPRNITPDLQRAPNWSVSGDEQAIAENKILSRYFDILKENGVYDNSDIIVTADHGIKTHDDGKYPLLLIKRAGETSEGITVSDAPISHIDIYPTLMYLAGEENVGDTVFDISEDAQRERYYSWTDEYISGNIKE